MTSINPETTTDSVDSSEDHESGLPKMGFLDHLEELRKRLLISFIAITVGFMACWHYADRIYAKLQEPLTKILPKGDFISPGLYRKERRWAAPFILVTSALFILGGYFGWRVMLPATCTFFVGEGKNFKQMITIDDYFSFASMLCLAAGIVFETPVLVFFLARLGIVTPKFMMAQWKYAIVISFIVAAIVTPTPDPVNQTILAVPMIALYFLGVFVAWAFAKKPAT